jgi:type VI secretion system secreted protein Hcp
MAGPYTKALIAAGLVGALTTPLRAFAAETAHLFLKANGLDVKGESTQTSLGRADSIECVAFFTSANSTSNAPIRIVIKKRVDKSTPLLMKALGDQQAVDGIFKFFRPNPTGDGTTEQFYTVDFKSGRIVAVEQVVPDTLEVPTANIAPLDAVTFEASIVRFTYTNGGITYDLSKGVVR